MDHRIHQGLRHMPTKQKPDAPHQTPMFWIPSPINAKPFSHIAMDLITGLPKSRGHDAILTIVDHGCSRAAIFLPCSTTITGTGITQLYLEHLF
jgi:hypothetical protein